MRYHSLKNEGEFCLFSATNLSNLEGIAYIYKYFVLLLHTALVLKLKYTKQQTKFLEKRRLIGNERVEECGVVDVWTQVFVIDGVEEAP